VGVIRLRVPGTLKYRSVALRVVTEACRLVRGRDAEQDAEHDGDDFEAQTVSAFGEAFNNVAIHGYADVTPGEVDIEVDWTAEEIVIQVTDTGRTFDPETIGPPALDELPEEGMGLFIMRSFMDEVDYRPGPPNVLRLKKRRGSEDERRPDDFPPFSEESSKPPDELAASSSRNEWRMSAAAGAGDRAPAAWVNEGEGLDEPGESPTPRIAARLVGGSRRT
jgi:serine/threonine-protein kinase RsbW